VASADIRDFKQVGAVVRRVDPLNRADVAASAAILVPATALVPAHESGHLVSVGVLTGASDNHLVSLIVHPITSNPGIRFLGIGKTDCLVLSRIIQNGLLCC
jgi:hypothetical protein